MQGSYYTLLVCAIFHIICNAHCYGKPIEQLLLLTNQTTNDFNHLVHTSSETESR